MLNTLQTVVRNANLENVRSTNSPRVTTSESREVGNRFSRSKFHGDSSGPDSILRAGAPRALTRLSKVERAVKTQARPVLVSLQRLPFRDFTAEEFLGRSLTDLPRHRWLVSIFQGSRLTLGQMADACVYVGWGTDSRFESKAARSCFATSGLKRLRRAEV